MAILVMPRMTARERFLLRVHSVREQRNLHQKDLKGSNSEQWISNKLRGLRDLSLNEAEEIADALQVPLAELLRRPDDLVYELDNLEGRLIDAFRQLNAAEQDALLTLSTLRLRPAPYATGRKVATLQATQAKGAAHGGASSPARVAANPERVSHILARAVQEIFNDESGRQAPTPSTPRTELPDDRRKTRRSITKPA